MRTMTICAHRKLQRAVLFFFLLTRWRAPQTASRCGAHIRPSRTWRLSGGWSLLKERLRLKPGSNDAAAVASQEGRDPAHSWMLRSSLDVSKQIEFDVIVRRVAGLSNPTVP